MKLTFVSNYINHHQIPVSTALYEKLGQNYCFIQVEPMAEERVKMGWGIGAAKLPFLKCFYEEPEICRKLIMESDMVVFGGVEDESYIKPRLSAGRPIIRYSERLYREGQWKAVSPRGLIKKYQDHTRYRKAPVYLLCSGAYVASDFHIVRSYPDKMLKWGYFPEQKKYEENQLFDKKTGKEKPVRILWAGRFLPLKHPEYALLLAEHLKKKNIPFSLTLIGGGELEKELHEQAESLGLTDDVCFMGFQKPEAVREQMEQADIFLMTSNYLEGWGAVINEAMNSGCAVVADASIGAVPFLLQHGINGLVYKDGDLSEFFVCAETLACDRELCRKLGNNAYQTILKNWNPETAAGRLLQFAETVLEKYPEKPDFPWEDGPCSKALVISPRKGYSYTRRNGKKETE